jgi:hypothetical protein
VHELISTPVGGEGLMYARRGLSEAAAPGCEACDSAILKPPVFRQLSVKVIPF